MKAFIMAGGKGTRLFGITNDEIPKPMAIFAGKPILQHAIENLKSFGITEIYVSVSHLYEKITNFFGDGSSFGVNIEYIIEQQPLGSAGALYFVKNKVEDELLICSGDVLFNIDIDKMLQFHRDNNSLVTMLTHPNLHPYDSDLVVTDKQNKVLKIDSKNNVREYFYKNNVNAGFFIVNKKALYYFTEVKKTNMEHDFINHLIMNNENVYAYKSPEYIKDIGTVERFENAVKDYENGLIKRKCLTNKQKAIFIDRDGVINKFKGFIRKIEDIELEEGVIEAIKSINKSEYLAIIVSNQPVIARGECTFEQVDEMFNKIETILGENGAYIDGIYWCPHHPHSGFEGEVKELKIECECRKPKIGMLKKAEKEFNLSLKDCFIIGDSNIDVQTGINAGIKQIKIESDLQEEKKTKATYESKNLFDAVNLILSLNKC